MRGVLRRFTVDSTAAPVRRCASDTGATGRRGALAWAPANARDLAYGGGAPRAPSRGLCPDLRGYGESSKVAPYTKRAMVSDAVVDMRALGHERFAVVGHDRGAYVAMRLALEHPSAVARLVVIESMPLLERLERATGVSRQLVALWFGQVDKPAEASDQRGSRRVVRGNAEHMGEEDRGPEARPARPGSRPRDARGLSRRPP